MMGRQTIGARGYANARSVREQAKTTALERRHPLIVQRKREERERAEQDRRYRDGDCTICGYPLDDVSLAGGYDRCGECEQV